MGFGVVEYKCLICMNINGNIKPSSYFLLDHKFRCAMTKLPLSQCNNYLNAIFWVWLVKLYTSLILLCLNLNDVATNPFKFTLPYEFIKPKIL
jgi:hypothetical protein